MKKVLFSAALFFTACAVSAQESVVKEAKSAKSDPVKAAQIIEPALTDPSTANDPETWKLAGDFQKSIYDDENMKLYLPGGQADTAKLYNSLAKMFEYYTKCDEVEQAKVQSGELKKPKLRKKLAKTLATVRPQLTNAGSDAYNAGNYANALKFFGLYVDAPQNPLFADEDAVKNDTLTPLIANYAALAANSLKDNAAVIKYATIGKEHKEEGYRSLMCLAEAYGKGETPDSAKWLTTIQEGVEKFPSQEYFIGNLMDYYIQKGKIDEGLAQMDAVLAAIAQQCLKAGRIGRGRDDQDILNARQHKGGQRIVDHGLVVDRQQLLGGHERERVQARAGPAGEDDAFHRLCLPFQSLRYRSRVYTFSGTSSSADSVRLATITAAMRLNSASDAITGRPSKAAALSVGS